MYGLSLKWFLKIVVRRLYLGKQSECSSFEGDLTLICISELVDNVNVNSSLLLKIIGV